MPWRNPRPAAAGSVFTATFFRAGVGYNLGSGNRRKSSLAPGWGRLCVLFRPSSSCAFHVGTTLMNCQDLAARIEKLQPDEEGKHVVAVVELTYGIIQNLIAYEMEKKYGRHLNTHIGLCKELRTLGEDKTAEIFETIDTFRHGRWYGGKGNGNIVKKCLELIKEVESWLK